MKKTAIRFGLYSFFTLVALCLVSFATYTGNYKTQEVITWSGIVLSVLFVYFGLKYYRDKQNNGSLSFGQGLKLGLLIVLFPSVAFGLYNLVYIGWLDPQFLDKYYAYEVNQIKSSVSSADLDKRLKEVEEQRQLFGSPLVQFIAMFLSVFVVGLIVTVISTLILKRKTASSVQPQ